MYLGFVACALGLSLKSFVFILYLIIFSTEILEHFFYNKNKNHFIISMSSTHDSVKYIKYKYKKTFCSYVELKNLYCGLVVVLQEMGGYGKEYIKI